VIAELNLNPVGPFMVPVAKENKNG